MPSALAHSGHHFVVAPTYWDDNPLVRPPELRRGDVTLAKIVATSHDVRVPGY
jgi:hypothetical protein